MGLGSKFVRLAKGGYSATQVLQRVNRSPLRYVVKGVASLANANEKVERRNAARAFRPQGVEVNAVNDLNSRAWTQALCLDSRLTAELMASSLALRGRHLGAGTHKSFIDRLLDPDFRQGLITQDSIWVRFALQPSVLRVVSGYLKEMPYLSYVVLTDSKYVGDNYQVSQLWHLDYDDVSMIKLFAYLTDVNDDSDGPFTFLPKDRASAARSMRSTHLADREVFRNASESEASKIIGKAGTAFLLDTSRCPHMGGRIAPERNRLLYTALYITAPPIYPDFDNRIRITGDIDPIIRMVLSRG